MTEGRGFKSHWHHCVVFLSKNINPSLVLVQPRKTRPFITERLLMGRKESKPTKQTENKGINENLGKHFIRACAVCLDKLQALKYVLI